MHTKVSARVAGVVLAFLYAAVASAQPTEIRIDTRDVIGAGGNAIYATVVASPPADTDTKWQAAEFSVEVADGITAALTRNISGLIVRSHYNGNSPGYLANLYGQHTIVGPQRGTGYVGGAFAHYVSVGAHGSYSGYLTRAVNYYASDCIKDNPAAWIGECIGLDIAAHTKGANLNRAIRSGGPNELRGALLIELDGTVKQVEQGSADSCGVGYRCLRVPNQ